MDNSDKSKKKGIIKVSSISDLDGFIKVADDGTLIHKSTMDFWKISDDGSYIEQLYDDSGDPFKC